jgi:hypothetical protein
LKETRKGRKGRWTSPPYIDGGTVCLDAKKELGATIAGSDHYRSVRAEEGKQGERREGGGRVRGV